MAVFRSAFNNIFKRSFLHCLTFLTATLAGCMATPMGHRQDVQQFIEEVSVKNNFNRAELTNLFNDVKSDQRIIKTMTKPAEAKPWPAYRQIFLTQKRIYEGAAFWQANAYDLARAEKQYGVPASIIVAILGVETNYGKNQGGFRVIDSLSTLAFDYPPRSNFFKHELEQYLLLTREQHLDPKVLLGSYAGAIGQPQFMPSSYRSYAVDFDNDGISDLSHNTTDVIGSVGNYLKAKGWQTGQVIAIPAKVINGKAIALPPQNKKLNFTIKELTRYGIVPTRYVPPKTPVDLLRYDTNTKPELWLVFENFYVITRYNSSKLYAMAVYQLSQEIAALRKLQLQAEKKTSLQTK